MNTALLQSIHTHPGLVDVQWRPHMGAVHLAWQSEYDHDGGYRIAIIAALDFAKRKRVENWLVDLSNSNIAARPADMAWRRSRDVQVEFRSTSLRRFAMMPPRNFTGRGAGWLSDWEERTVRVFGRGARALLSQSIDDIEAFFADELEGTSYGSLQST